MFPLISENPSFKSTWSSLILWHLSTPPNSLCTILLGCVVRCSESAFLHPHYDDGSWSILQFSIPTQVFPTVQCQGKNILYLKKMYVLCIYILYIRNVWFMILHPLRLNMIPLQSCEVWASPQRASLLKENQEI